METREIEYYLKQNNFSSDFFRGVYPVDLLPIKKFKRPSSFICNTDSSNGPGVHWVAIYLPKNSQSEYFDSFGLEPLNKEIIDFLRINGENYVFNKNQIQSDFSNSCGKFCILFILFRSKNMSLKSFIHLFSSDKIYNEKFINYLFNKFFEKSY